MKQNKIYTVSSETLANELQITRSWVNTIAKNLGITHSTGSYNSNLYTLEDANRIREERIRLMKTKKSLYTVVYVTQTYHIYESKINLMV